VKNVGAPSAGKSHAPFDVGGKRNQASQLDWTAQAPPADPTATDHEGRTP
jgi:hypothetical protein